jgi:hypothetical protein
LDLGNLVLWGKSQLNGFAGKDSGLFWSTGVLEKAKTRIEYEKVLIITPVLHHSITPADFRMQKRF